MDHDDYKVEEESPGKVYQRFDKEVGSGSFKKVYLGFDTKEGRQVAWCQISMKKLNKAEKKRIFEETNLLQNIKHERILSAIACWYNQEKDEVVIINQLYPGGSLKDFIVSKFDQENKKDQLRFTAKKKWCKQILEGLHFLHSKNPPILHRDLKCDNIFYDSQSGNVLIGDLGLSKAALPDHTRGTMLGTPEFMAPEVYKGKYDTKADMYAFGLVLLEMFTGRIPFEEYDTIPSIMIAVCENKLPRLLDELEQYFKDKPKELEPTEHIIRKLLSPKPEDRPSALELLEDPYFKLESDRKAGSSLSSKSNRLVHRNVRTAKQGELVGDDFIPPHFLTEVPLSENETFPLKSDLLITPDISSMENKKIVDLSMSSRRDEDTPEYSAEVKSQIPRSSEELRVTPQVSEERQSPILIYNEKRYPDLQKNNTNIYLNSEPVINKIKAPSPIIESMPIDGEHFENNYTISHDVSSVQFSYIPHPISLGNGLQQHQINTPCDIETDLSTHSHLIPPNDSFKQRSSFTELPTIITQNTIPTNSPVYINNNIYKAPDPDANNYGLSPGSSNRVTISPFSPFESPPVALRINRETIDLKGPINKQTESEDKERFEIAPPPPPINSSDNN